MSAAAYVASAVFAVMTVVMFATVGRMNTSFRHDKRFRITPPLIILGFWEISVGAVLAVLGYWEGAIPVTGLGVICLAANVFMPHWEDREDDVSEK